MKGAKDTMVSTRTDAKVGAKTTATPGLRFSGFRDKGVWKADKLERLASFANEKMPLELLTLVNFVSTENLLPDYKGAISASKLPQSGTTTRFQEGDILISNIRPYLKKVWFADKGGGASNDVLVLRAKEKVSAQYLSFILKNDAFIKYVMKGAKGVKMPRGDISLIKKYPLMYPTLPEQQKIADCLTSLDELISAEDEKLSTFKDHKKGLLQKLFPAEGKTIPKLRFPEFRDKGAWEVKFVSKVANVVAGQSPKGSNYNDEGMGVPFYQGKTDFGDVYINPPQKWTTQTTKLAQKGDILISVRAPVGALNISTDKICIGRGLASIQAKQSKWYLYYFLKSNQKYIIGNGGSIFDSINKNQIEAIKILIPTTISEQQKIADCLISLDELISAQGEKLKALKDHKKGLMQKLFPAQQGI